VIHVCIPYDSGKNLGAVYNQSIRMVGDDPNYHHKFIVVMDHDAMFLTPDAIKHIDVYAERFPDTGIFTCYTNRLHPDSKGQLLGPISENDSIRHHIEIAEKQKSKLYEVTEIDHPIGGFLMVIKIAAWEKVGGFSENGKCLGVDNDFSGRILKAGYKILCMSGVYVFHTYRLIGGYKSKIHLK
jgi:GT2 family glycosyltransferase